MESILKEGDTVGKVFLPKTHIDKGTMAQIRTMMAHPAITEPRIMPDCHKGSGCCIGFTSKLDGKIVPKFVGGDIGCGILTLNVGDLSGKFSLEKLDEIIRTNVKMGSGVDSVWSEPIVKDVDIFEICVDAAYDASNFMESYRRKFKTNIYQSCPEYGLHWFENLCQKINIEKSYAMCSLGTLGGGNHYIEINQNDETNDYYITIHSGSRGFGAKVCAYHQSKIDSTNAFDYEKYKLFMKKVNRMCKDTKKLKEISDKYKKEFREKQHANYLESEEAFEYYFDMIFAQKYAQYNRRKMLTQILSNLALLDLYDEDKIIESIHNYIDFSDMIMRKGAIAAYEQQLCIVSLNMRDGILICEGKSNPDWNYSAAHGSGRLLTRQEANNKISLNDFKQSMEGVYSSSVVNETIDEAPMTYKDSDMIKEALENTVTIIRQLKPILNVKALT